MNDIAIRVEGLSKLYRLGENEGGYRTLRDTLTDTFMAPFRRVRDTKPREAPATLWALKDVSFEIKHGEVIGVIGRNGAGKSTLLKILSRITEPTHGRIEIKGRVGSLLEVGTGFHPELSGRENIFLNGAILGMKRAEILRKFDEIVAFSEVDKFIDTPVKHYSSGMYVRLAFAVAAHMETEILIIDEVLAVGDIGFQKKCLGKVGQASRDGRTVLFVSHNMAAIRQLTRSCICLDKGLIAFQGPTNETINHYLKSLDGAEQGVYDVENAPRAYPKLPRHVQFVSAQVGRNGEGVFAAAEDIRLRLRVFGNRGVNEFRLSFTIFGAEGTPVGSAFCENHHSIRAHETQDIELRIERHNLAPGRYYFGLGAGKGDHLRGHVDFDVVLDVCHFEVLPPAGDDGTVSYWTPGWGAIRFEDVQSSQISAPWEATIDSAV